MASLCFLPWALLEGGLIGRRAPRQRGPVFFGGAFREAGFVHKRSS